jgi:CDP-diglyceride synthetase
MINSAKKVIYSYGVFLFISWGLMFIIHRKDYAVDKIKEGMIFIIIVTLVLFILTHIYYRDKSGQKIVRWSLVILFLINSVCFYIVY